MDCCGLVRQTVYEMRDDFKFVLQRWNQGYQFDTCPIKLELKDMKPGDLIFYSATFYKPESVSLFH